MSAIVYQLKISLSMSQPEIWRRFLVTDQTRLDDLHDIIQAVMGWENQHLYQFIINQRLYGDSSLGRSASRSDAADFSLGSLIKRPKTRFIYEYDLGDGWEHEILVEKIRPRAQFDVHQLPFCLAGEQACPFEDCGGIFGYYEILETLQNPESPEYPELVDIWGVPGQDFDPAHFDLDFVNHSLHDFLH